MFSVGAAFSQAEGPEGKDENLPRFRFTTSVDAVHLNVSVVNKKGKLVTDLEQSDFRVLENDVIQDITYFSRGTDAPGRRRLARGCERQHGCDGEDSQRS